MGTMRQRNILIVGGGTAGWMAANLFAKKWIDKGFTITLLESEDVGTIGVGEGSTPYIRRLFEQLNIAESEWMPRCGATYKNGIQFNHWTDKVGYESYFHPFNMDIDNDNFSLFKHHIGLRHQGVNIKAHPDDYFIMSKLTKKNRLPFSDNALPSNAFYAYHFDSSLLGEFLKENALKLGVKHISNKVTKVEVHLNFDIAAVHTQSGERIAADLFVDCTGFRSVLMSKTLKVPFVSFKDNLLNDSAVAIPTKANINALPQTLSEAMTNGWRWNIPLTHRTGNGYVYSSEYISSSNAETELRRAIGEEDSDVEARHIKMRVGRSQKHWENNCLAVGLSQGFIEPLEATALQIVQVTIEQFILHYEKSNFGQQHQQQFNDGVNAMFEHIRDYIVVHYLANTRTDTQYWKDCRGDIAISDSLRGMLEVWSSGGNIETELNRQKIQQYYPSLSWHTILAGMGVFPPLSSFNSSASQKAQEDMERVKAYAEKCLTHFSTR